MKLKVKYIASLRWSFGEVTKGSKMKRNCTMVGEVVVFVVVILVMVRKTKLNFVKTKGLYY